MRFRFFSVLLPLAGKKPSGWVCPADQTGDHVCWVWEVAGVNGFFKVGHARQETCHLWSVLPQGLEQGWVIEIHLRMHLPYRDHMQVMF